MAEARPIRPSRGWVLLALVVLALSASAAYAYLFTDAAVQEERMVVSHYGNWAAVAFALAFFSIFVLGFLRSPRRRDWRHLGLAEAYLVALFTEMFGLPLTIYLIGSVLGVKLGLSGLEGHLWILAIGSGLAAVLLAAGVLGGFALADDGGVMQQLMGHDAYAAMVNQMRAVLGNERADQMLASCETAMASSDQGAMPNSMQRMMSGMGSMMGSR
ncbi:MAG: hypothetical protein ACRDGT_00035 [Candidatus Limnocylindria bacterium]